MRHALAPMEALPKSQMEVCIKRFKFMHDRLCGNEIRMCTLMHSCWSAAQWFVYLWLMFSTASMLLVLLQEGEAATVSLLAMAQRTIEQMDPTTAAQHADLCFTFLLRALDLRQKRPASLPVLQTVEQGSVGVLLALTMKLSEAKFKPLFLRLLDWGGTPPAAQPNAKPLGRQVALFTAVLGLTERLRSVFVPYFRYLLDLIVAQLGGASGDAGTAPRKKKKKKTGSVAVAVGDESSGEPAVVEDTWRLRFKVCMHASLLCVLGLGLKGAGLLSGHAMKGTGPCVRLELGHPMCIGVGSLSTSQLQGLQVCKAHTV